MCLCVCLGYNFCTAVARNFIFSIQIHLIHIKVRLEDQSHYLKVRVNEKTDPDLFTSPLLLYCIFSYVQLKFTSTIRVIERSWSTLLSIQVKWKEIIFLFILNVFVIFVLCGWYDFDWKAFWLHLPFTNQKDTMQIPWWFLTGCGR